MKKNKIIFVGGIGTKTQFGGELTKNKEIIKRLSELGCSLILIDTYQARSKPFKLLILLFKLLYNIIFNSKSTFVFSTSFGNIYPIFKLYHLFLSRVRIVYWVIGGIFSQRVVNGEFSHKYLKDIDLFLVEGIKMKKELMQKGYDNVHYVPNFKTVCPLPVINNRYDDKTHFYFLSRIMPEKGCNIIMDAMKLLNKEGMSDKYSVDFYGNISQSYNDDFSSALSRLDNAHYKGCLQLTDENNYKALTQYHCMLFPTYWVGEGFPGVIIDAYKAGNLIVASDWNFNTEFVENDKTGYIIKTHSVLELAKVMKKIMQEKSVVELKAGDCQKQALKYDTKNVINEKLLQLIVDKIGKK